MGRHGDIQELAITTATKTSGPATATSEALEACNRYDKDDLSLTRLGKVPVLRVSAIPKPSSPTLLLT